MTTHWNEGIPAERIEAVVRAASAAGHLDPPRDTLLFHDTGRMRERLGELARAFGPEVWHAVAIKANPLVRVLAHAVDAGAGLEAASMEEVHIGLAAGCPADRLVYDSPAKRSDELERALELGVVINADSFDELARIAALIERRPSRSRIGLRVNPRVGSGSIGITSVADRGSKFGVDIESREAGIVEAFSRYPWLIGLHVHVGSQGCELEQLVAAAARVQALREEIDRGHGHRRIRFVDIGGGLPAAYVDGAAPPTPDRYVRALRESVPALFDGTVDVFTEFGRAIQASCGFAVSRVEYVKPELEPSLAVIHLGADFLMRPVYQPEDWPHRYLALDATGRPKDGPLREWSVAGPLCFGGDIPARSVALPALAPGDLVVVRDTGAYTLSLWSRHCNRGIPRVLGTSGDPPRLELLREAETAADLVRFWDAPPLQRDFAPGRP